MHKEFLLLENKIKEISENQPVYYYANRGNLGDALIRYGTFKFFESTGIKYKELKTQNKREWFIPVIRGGTLIYGGGGAWCTLFNNGLRFINRVHKYFKKIIILPSTYEITSQFPNVTYFCRDKYESKINNPSAIFCHDMAFFIKRKSSDSGNGVGYLFRTDKESTGKIDIPLQNIDISKNGNHFSDINPFFNEIAKYSVIHTDRLHVAIIACLFEKEVHLYPSSYFKIKAIYLSSIKKNFENVYFHEL